jgi:hypothetical protein
MQWCVVARDVAKSGGHNVSAATRDTTTKKEVAAKGHIGESCSAWANYFTVLGGERAGRPCIPPRQSLRR